VKFALSTLLFMTICASGAMAGVVVQFEDFAPPGGLVNVAPETPYSEAGFTFMPDNADSAIFDAAEGAGFPGDPTSWFGFAAGNTITVTGEGPFELDSILVGPSTLGSGTTTVTFTGDIFGGGTPLTATFSDLETATLETFEWGGLADFTISATTDSAIDNVTSGTGTPEPASALLLLGTAGLLGTRRVIRRGA